MQIKYKYKSDTNTNQIQIQLQINAPTNHGKCQQEEGDVCWALPSNTNTNTFDKFDKPSNTNANTFDKCLAGPNNVGKVDTVPHYHLNTTKHLCHTSLLNRGLPISNSQIIPNLVPNSVFPYTQICHVTRSDFGCETGQQMENQDHFVKSMFPSPIWCSI